MAQNNLIDISRSESSPTEPCTLAEAKAQCIVTYTDDDTLITALITKARKMIENYCNISIVAQSIVMIADLYNEWELPYGPVTGITGVQTRTGNEGSGPGTYTTQTTGWSTEGLQFVSFRPAGAGGFNPGEPFRGYFQWGPFASPYGYDPYNRYKISYTTGYAVVPDDLKQAVLGQIAWLYEHRFEEKDNVVCDAARIVAEPYVRKLWQ
jgi:hypothetical protein